MILGAPAAPLAFHAIFITINLQISHLYIPFSPLIMQIYDLSQRGLKQSCRTIKNEMIVWISFKYGPLVPIRHTDIENFHLTTKTRGQKEEMIALLEINSNLRVINDQIFIFPMAHWDDPVEA